MLWLLRFSIPLLLCQAATVTIERGAAPSSFISYNDNPEDKCEYAGELLLSHPMSVEDTDKHYVLGSQMLQSAHLSLNAINLWPRCGVHLEDGNYSLRLRTYGDKSSKNMTAAIGRAIVNQTDFLLSGYSSTLTGELAPIAQENGKLLLAGGSAQPRVFVNRSHVFGLLPNSATYLKVAFRGLDTKGAKSVAFVSEDDVKSCSSVPAMAEQYDMVFLNGTYLPTEAPYEMYLEAARRFAQLDPDVVVTCVRTKVYPFWNQAQRAVGWSPKAQIYTIVFGNPEFEEALGTDLPYVMGVASWDRALPPVPDTATGWTPAKYDRAMEAAYFRRPVYQQASQSAAISILVQAMERVGNYHDQDAMVKEIANGYFPTRREGITLHGLA